MIIFNSDNNKYVYIHIPKNNGKYIRSLIKKQYTIIKTYWDIKNNIDLAHIPISMASKYLDDNINNYKFISFIRNPYDRIISAFFYKNPKKNKHQLNDFIINNLTKINFLSFDPATVHYCPQYLFLEGNPVEILSFKNIQADMSVGSIKLKMINFMNKKYETKKYLIPESIKIIDQIYNQDVILYNSI